MTKYIYVLCLSLLSFSWGYTLQDVQKILSAPEKTTADFNQERQIKGVIAPLKSSGSLIVTKKDGLFWQQKAPFELTLELTENMISQQVKGGEKEIISVKTNPQMFQFNKLLLSLFYVDEALLNENFRVEFSSTAKEWHIQLFPKKLPMNKIFNNIVLKGGAFLNYVEILDLQGDRTVIHFSKQHAE